MKKPEHSHVARPTKARLKIWKNGTLQQEDWDFSKCLDDEIEDCFYYEYARESQEAISHVHQARQQARGNTFDDLNRLNWEDRPAYMGDKTPRSLPVGLFAVCPEWPEKPFLSVPRPQRKQRLTTYWSNAIEHEDVVTDICKLAGLEMTPGYHELGGTIQSIEDECQWYVALGINWQRSDENMLQSFAAWLKESRPQKIKPILKGKVGAGSTFRQMKADLKALGAFRLLREHGTCHKAYNAIYDVRDGNFLPQHGSAWSRSKRRAENLIRQPYDPNWFLGNLNRPPS